MGRPPRLMVIVAHPDDETFGCGSLLLHARAAGAITRVCCATRGELGDSPGAGTPAELGRQRERELREAARLLGVGQVDLLDHSDSGMTGEPPPGSLCAAPFDDVVGEVTTQLREFEPDVVVTLDAGDGHRDHARIRDATLAAAATTGVARAYLMCLPRSLMQRWIDRMRVDRPDVAYLDADTAELGTPDEQITTVIDVADHLPMRRRAIAVHASQTSPFDGLPEDLAHAFLATDHARRVIPPWSGGPQESHVFPPP